ncbi:MAG: alpha/beta hydrolase [Candidatus Omnitrophica bacterium]|nr:alpha/beta hydrolase [Candidatus Omnitrophota bacterium]
MRKQYAYFFSFLTLITGLFLILSSPSEVSKTYVKFSAPSPGATLQGKLYLPKNKSNLGIVLVHGVIWNKEYMDLMAQTLADNGLMVLTFDIGGYAESYHRAASQGGNAKDVLAAVSFLRKQWPNPADAAIGIVGHSMGGSAVILAGLNDPNIHPVICLGMNTDRTIAWQNRFLFSAGLYDQLHPPSEMRQMMPPIHSSFDQQASRLFLSPTANHQIEVFDYNTLAETIHWCRQTEGIPGQPVKLTALKFHYGKIFAGLGLFLVLNLLLCPYPNKRSLSLIFFVSAVVFFMLNLCHVLAPFVCSTIIIFIICVMLIANYWTKERHPSLMRSFYLSFGFIAILDIVNVGNAIGEYISRPDYVLGIPAYIIQTWFNYLPCLFIFLRPHLFIQYSTALVPSWGLIVIFIVELCSPGLWVQLLVNLTHAHINHARLGTRHDQKKFYPQIFRLSGALIVFGLILRALMAHHLINREILLTGGGIFTCRLLPAVVLLILLTRKLPVTTPPNAHERKTGQ